MNKLRPANRLPTVWIPPRELRDLRELTLTRMYFTRMRTGLKNRVHSELAKYGLSVEALPAPEKRQLTGARFQRC